MTTMFTPDTTWQTEETSALFDAIVALRDRDDAARFFRDLCTLGELRDLAQRWQVARLLATGMHYGEISRRTGASTATVTRIAQWLHHGTGGYALALARLRAREEGSAAASADIDATLRGASELLAPALPPAPPR